MTGRRAPLGLLADVLDLTHEALDAAALLAAAALAALLPSARVDDHLDPEPASPPLRPLHATGRPPFRAVRTVGGPRSVEPVRAARASSRTSPTGVAGDPVG